MMISFDVYHNIKSSTSLFFSTWHDSKHSSVWRNLTCFFGNLVQSRALESIDGGFVVSRMGQENIFFSRRNLISSLQSKDCLSYIHMPRLGVHGKKTNTHFNLETYCSLAMLSNVWISLESGSTCSAAPHRLTLNLLLLC